MSSVAFVAEMKLRRLRETRDVLLSEYAEIEAAKGRAAGPEEALRILYDGLRGVVVAGHRVHQEVVNLEAVLLGASTPAAWLARLEGELAAGKLRAELLYAYAALLGDWVSHEGPVPDPGDAARIEARITRGASPIDREAVLAALDALDLSGPRTACAAFDDEGEPAEDGGAEVSGALAHIASDPEKAPALRAEARRFLSDDDLRKDLVDAMGMLLEGIDDWSWPDAGFALRSVWTGDRYRVHVGVDLVTALLLDIVASRWSATIAPALRGDRSSRMMRLKRLRELNAPAIILQQEEKLLAAANAGLLADPVLADPEIAPGSIAARREAVLTELMSAGLRASQYGGEYGTALRSLLFVADAEVTLARALGRPLFVVKSDITDFFPSVSHELALLVAERFGVPLRWRAFFAKYLAVRTAAPAGPRALAVGLPLGHDLSRLLGEMILAVIEAHVRRGLPRLRIARLVDDIVLFAPSAQDAREAWRRLQEIVTAMGLVLAAPKSGSVVVGDAPMPDDLPAGAVRIGALELTGDGAWMPSEPAIAEATALARQKIGEARSLLDAVAVANTHLRRFVAALAPSAPLGPEHLSRVGERVTRFQETIFEGGLHAHLTRRVTSLAPGAWIDRIPRAWLHWPLTAGGLGLVDGHVELAPFAHAPPPTPIASDEADEVDETDEATVETEDGVLASQYDERLTPHTPAAPEENPVLDGLAADFVKRRSEIHGGAASANASPSGAELAPYWRWVLSTHGPDILAAFGSYRFLLHQLLPIHLIQSRRFRKATPRPDATGDDDIPF